MNYAPPTPGVGGANIPNMRRDRFGFKFWLGWMFWFAVSWAAAAAVWTAALTQIFGRIAEKEVALMWAISVFGSWFLLLVPFMRKKEQIWKRLNEDQERSVNAWWTAMAIFTGLLFLSALFWSLVFKSRIAAPHGGFDPLWAKAVAASGLALTLPFLVLMYRRADQIFKMAAIRQGAGGQRFRTTFVEKSKRTLPAGLSEKLRAFPESIKKGHVVTLILKDGRRIPNCFISDRTEILGVYDRLLLDVDPAEITDLEPASAQALPVFEEEKWLRLDGRA